MLSDKSKSISVGYPLPIFKSLFGYGVGFFIQLKWLVDDMGILIIWVWWCGVIQLKCVGDGKGSRLSMAKLSLSLK